MGCCPARAWLRPERRGPRGESGGRLRSGGEALAPFRPAAGKNGTARLGSHPDQEPVRPAPVTVVRLERAFRFGHGARTLRRGKGILGASAGPVNRWPLFRPHGR